eukprot:SAG11_NODE_387_length_9883_cov_9.365699_15_plen_722_part_00
MMRLLLLMMTSGAAAASLFVDPGRGDDTNDGVSASSALRTLASARQRVRQALSEGPQNSIVVELLPGRHRVPSGGLVLDARDSPADGHNVVWRGRPGTTSLSGGEPVSGWKLTGDPTLPTGVYSAPVPAALRGSSARHLFIDGVRAVRTRRNATTALPGLALEDRSECQACSYSVDNSSNVLAWSNPGDVELVYSGVLASWAEERCAVDSVGPSLPPPPLPPPPPAPAAGSCSGAIHIHHTQGCFNYSDWKQGAFGSVFPTHASAVDGVKLTLESCAAACYQINHSTASSHLAGVMDGSHCFCGTAADLTSAVAKARALPKGTCETQACQGNPARERSCGGVGSMLVYAYSCDGATAVAAQSTETNSSSSVRITMKQPCFWNLVKGKPLSMGNTTQRFSRARPDVVFPIIVENVREQLSTPGQWYFDKAKQEVLYYPLVGQDMSKVDAILAIEETLVKHVGAQNHAWYGLTFEFGTWLRPMQGAGFVEEQTGACDICPYGAVLQEDCGAHDTFVVTPANVVVSAGRNIDFANCTFKHLGAYAVNALNGSQNVSWRGCKFEDVSAGALALGDVTTADVTATAQWDMGFLVEDCVLANLPVEFTGAAAVAAFYVANTTIQHNHIANTTYSGISLGWGKCVVIRGLIGLSFFCVSLESDLCMLVTCVHDIKVGATRRRDVATITSSRTRSSECSSPIAAVTAVASTPSDRSLEARCKEITFSTP